MLHTHSTFGCAFMVGHKYEGNAVSRHDARIVNVIYTVVARRHRDHELIREAFHCFLMPRRQ